MIKLLLYFALMCLLVLILSALAKEMLKKHFKKNSQLEHDEISEEFKVVLSSTEKEYKPKHRDIKGLPIDANDIQNLDKKYSPNVYRGSDGRFKSFKK